MNRDDADTADFVAVMDSHAGLYTAGETGFGSVPLDRTQWEAITPEGLIVQLKLATVNSLSGEEPLPRTYGFTTRAGNWGVLQITGLSENPRGLKLRYKLVQPPSAN